jgi:hypothetical protein
MIKYKTYICSTGMSFIFYFISTWDIIMFKVVIFVFSACQESLFFIQP